MKTLSDQLRQRVLAEMEAGTTQNQLAERIGVQPSILSRWIKQGAGPRAATLNKVWSYLDLRISD